MKKQYTSPIIETTEIRFASMICEASPIGGGEMPGGGGSMFNPAPRRGDYIP